MKRSQDGFTIVELMVAITIFGITATGFYSVLFSGARGADRSRSVVRVSEEARMGLNRMIRDTREAGRLVTASPTSYRIEVDFNNNGTYDGNSAGNYEDLTYAYVPASGTSSVCPSRFGPGCITLNGQRLVVGVQPIAGTDVFNYTSNLMLYDCNRDGVTTWQELDQAEVSGRGCPARPEMGNANGVLDDERPFVNGVTYAIRVRQGGSVSNFYSEVQLRNLR